MSESPGGSRATDHEGNSMRAAMYDRYGPANVLTIVERPEPTMQDLMVEVVASSVNPKDTFVRKGRFKYQAGARFPKGTGYDFAGIVTASRVDDMPAGTPVYGMVKGWGGRSAADLVSCRRQEAAPAPRSLPLIDAAAIPLAGLTALQALRDNASLRPGQSVLINGASGGVGTYAIQIAKALGAEVTSVSSSASQEHCRRLGADHTHDYGRGRLPPGQRYDVVFDVFGNLSRREVTTVLKRTGRHVTTVPSAANLAATALTRFLPHRTSLVVVRSNHHDLLELSRLVQEGALVPEVQRRFPLTEVAAAHAHVESKHTRGKVLVVN
ncbi:NADP-dependent oxidoreductase [Streptomyces sp. NPDC051963]|uniref:NADP-dependent oxidoreductase n=1 Tax=Streptomyces sp. NPDC051963 TaxID=3365678 RepID=UPI0037D02EE1